MRRRGRRRGAGILETALCLLVVVTVFLAFVDFGLVMFAYNSVAWGASEGARYAALHGASAKTPATATSVSNRVKGILRGLEPSRVTVTTTWTPDNKLNSKVNVKVVYRYQPITPLYLGNLDLESNCKLQILQ